MRSLFIRIFISFWLAMTLIGTAFALVYVWNPFHTPHKRKTSVVSESLRRHGAGLVRLLGQNDRAAAEARIRRLQEELDIRVHVFRDGVLVPGPFLPQPEARAVARQATTQRMGVHRTTSRVDLFAITLDAKDARWAIVGELPHGPRLVRYLQPETLPIRLVILFVVSGLICYVLARTISRPIRTLQRVSQKLAAGELDARAGETLHRRRDETGALGREFDRMADQIQGLLGAQQRLLQDISHELRSPLARLNVALGLARQRAKAEQEGALDRIELEAERLNQLIGELTTLTLLESGAEHIGSEHVDLAALAAQVVRDADFEAKARGRQVLLSGDDVLELDGSAKLLHRALENVVRNGLRFTASNTAVEVTLARVAGPEGALARVQVRDHGPGVPETALRDIFQPFFRVADARERESGGVGMGLAISARAVTLHGGRIHAENAAGGGLLVEITLPLAASLGGRPSPP